MIFNGGIASIARKLNKDKLIQGKLMKSLLEQAKHHFQEVIQGQGLHCIEIPEWGEQDKPAKIYFRPLAAWPVRESAWLKNQSWLLHRWVLQASIEFQGIVS
jgi:hypothetical protein